MIAKLLSGYKVTQCLYVGAKLNIADHLLSGKKSISELAQLTDSNKDSLYRLLRCLASLGVFNEEPDQIFSLNKSSEDLLTDSETTWKDFIIFCGEVLYPSTGDLLYSVQSGAPAFDRMHGMNLWDYFETHPEKARLFHNAMANGTESMINRMISYYDFSSYKNIIDVGGGKGHLVCEILSQYPDASGSVFDRANAKQQADEYISSRSLSNRCKMITGDFFDSVVSGGDLYVLKVVLHDWDDESAILILQNCLKGMHKESKLLIIEIVIENNKFKNMACLGDINMLATLTGRERTIQEFSDLLKKSGLKFLQKIDTGTPFSIIEAGIN